MRLGFGCVTLGSSEGPTAREADRLVRSAIDAGVELFDTADAYAHGASERMLGRALAGRRDEVRIATKGGYCFSERSEIERRARRAAAPVLRRLRRARRASAGPAPTGTAYQTQDFSPAHLRSALEASLRRLRTDYVDVYQLHGPPGALPSVLTTLREFVDAGLVRRVGIGAEHVGSAIEWLQESARAEATRGVDVLQIPFGPLDPLAASSLLPTAQDQGVEVWARGVFGGGVLAAQAAGASLDPGDLRKGEGLRSIADELQLDVFELAVRFVASFPAVSVMMLGMSSEQHLRRNIALARDASPLDSATAARICALMSTDDHSTGAP